MNLFLSVCLLHHSISQYTMALTDGHLKPTVTVGQIISIDGSAGPTALRQEIENKFPTIKDRIIAKLDEWVQMNHGMPGDTCNVLESTYWDFWIAGTQGKLNLIRIVLKMSQGITSIRGFNIEGSVTIPTLYGSSQVCSRGSRRYFIAGPRPLECSTSYGARGLNPDEIRMVTDSLHRAIMASDAYKSIH